MEKKLSIKSPICVGGYDLLREIETAAVKANPWNHSNYRILMLGVHENVDRHKNLITHKHTFHEVDGR